MTHVLSQSNFKQREKPPEAHKTGMGEENCTHKEPQPGAVGQTYWEQPVHSTSQSDGSRFSFTYFCFKVN